MNIIIDKKTVIKDVIFFISPSFLSLVLLLFYVPPLRAIVLSTMVLMISLVILFLTPVYSNLFDLFHYKERIELEGIIINNEPHTGYKGLSYYNPQIGITYEGKEINIILKKYRLSHGLLKGANCIVLFNPSKPRKSILVSLNPYLSLTKKQVGS